MVCVQFSHVAVERGELLALRRTADDDVTALHIAVVKCVHRLTVFQHDIVCDVHDVVNGADAHRAKALAHPLGGGGNLHVAHHARRVARHEVRRRGFHAQKVFKLALRAAAHLRNMQAQLRIKGRRRLARKTDDGEAVRAVRRDLKLDDVVVEPDGGADILADGESGELRIVGQNPDAVFVCIGEVALLQPQLREGAEHAVGRFAAQRAGVDFLAAGQTRAVERRGDQVARLDVLRAGDDLDGLRRADVDAAHPHVVGVFVAVQLQHLAHDDLFNLRTEIGPSLHLGAGEGHVLGKFLIADRDGDELVQPFSAQIHVFSRSLLKTAPGI